MPSLLTISSLCYFVVPLFPPALGICKALECLDTMRRGAGVVVGWLIVLLLLIASTRWHPTQEPTISATKLPVTEQNEVATKVGRGKGPSPRMATPLPLSDNGESPLAALHAHHPEAYFQDDCVSSTVATRMAIALLVDPSSPPKSMVTTAEQTLRSLHLSLDLRTSPRYLVTSTEGREELQEAVNQARPASNFLQGLHVSTPRTGLGLDNAALLLHAATLSEGVVLVLPCNGAALDVEVRAYYLLATLQSRPQAILEHLQPLTIPIQAAVSTSPGSAVLLSRKYFPDTAIRMEMPTRGVPHNIHPALRWFVVTRRGKHYSDKQRNENLPELICKRPTGYFWLCDQVSPLLAVDPMAYMEEDCMSRYVADRLTVVITAHVAPSNPNPFLLRVLLQSLHVMPDIRHARKVIVYDGPSEEQAATKLNETLAAAQRMLITDGPITFNSTVLSLPERLKLRKTTEVGLQHVTTPFTMIVQPDLPFLRPPHLYYLLRSMEETKEMAYVRFNRARNHQSRFDFWLNEQVPNTSWVPLCHTPSFSSENHLVPTSLYDKVIWPVQAAGKFTRWGLSHCRTVECLMNKRQNKTPLFGMYIYGRIGDGPFSMHLDGSERHEKIPVDLLPTL